MSKTEVLRKNALHWLSPNFKCLLSGAILEKSNEYILIKKISKIGSITFIWLLNCKIFKILKKVICQSWGTSIIDWWMDKGMDGHTDE